MYAISLTSIPPRFHRLGPVLRSLLAQRPAPAQVLLCLPESYDRFPGRYSLPALPDGVTVLTTPADLGPATKALPAARLLAGQTGNLVYCDDDWLMGPGWAAALLDAQRPGCAVTGAGFGVERLQCRSQRNAACVDIAQGFSGVLVDPKWLTGPDPEPPATVRSVDDIWLSGQLARQRIPILTAPEARRAMRLAYSDDHALQDFMSDGHGRAGANRACAALLHARYGIWPPSPSTASAARR